MNVYLLAHQDDEWFCAPRLEGEASKNCIVIFLTDGASSVSSDVRNKESLAVLRGLGVGAENVRFLGEALNVADGTLCENLEQVFSALVVLLRTITVESLVGPCYEGGHPDHDAISWLLWALLEKKIGKKGVQFPLYNCAARRWPLFNVATLPVGQQQLEQSTSFKWKHFKLIRQYRSQAKTWFALCLVGALRFVIDRHLRLAQFDRKILRCPPHTGPLLYEQRGWLTYHEFSKHVERFEDISGLKR